MFSRSQIEKFLFFDIETAGGTSTLMELSEKLEKLWAQRCQYLRSINTHPENATMSDDQLFLEKAGLQAEFGKIVCISFGKVKFPDDPDLPPTIQIVSYAGEDEKEILIQAFKVFNGMAKNKIMPFGHNIKRFDIPYLCKRAFINGLEPALPLQVWDKKPWEIDVKDSSELWSFGAWQEGFTSLDLLTAVLGLPSPKEEMQGNQVHSNFWNGNISGIKEYCQKDVLSLIRVTFALSFIDQFDDASVIYK